jgi:hypothetical protein
MLAGGMTVERSLERRADQDDALLLRREGDQVPGDGRTPCREVKWK